MGARDEWRAPKAVPTAPKKTSPKPSRRKRKPRSREGSRWGHVRGHDGVTCTNGVIWGHLGSRAPAPSRRRSCGGHVYVYVCGQVGGHVVSRAPAPSRRRS
eukprot:2825257-Prymnesium_polylepis.1